MPRSFRLPDDVEQRLGAIAAATGQTVTDVVVAALRAHVDPMDLQGALINDLAHDFTAATFQLGRDEQGAPTVAVVDVERRTTDPLGRSYSATTAPLTQFVNVEARAAAEPGRTTIELVGLPGTDCAGVRVFVATLALDESMPPPGTRPGPTITAHLTDLHPLSHQRVPTSTEGDQR